MHSIDPDTIRELRRAEPFKPFRLVMRDGRKLPVRRAAAILVSLAGGTVIYAPLTGGFEFLPTADIVGTVVDKKKNSRRGGR